MTLASLAALAFSVLALLASPHGTLGTSWLRAYGGFDSKRVVLQITVHFEGFTRVVPKSGSLLGSPSVSRVPYLLGDLEKGP